MVLLRQLGAEVDEFLGGLFLVVLEWHGDAVGGLGVGTVDCFAPMTEVGHGLALRHPCRLGTLSPGVAVGVEDDAVGQASLDPLGPEVVAALAFLEGTEAREEGAFLGELEEDGFEGLSNDEAGVALALGAEFLSLVVEPAGSPVDVVGSEAGNVGLAAAGMPEELEVDPVFFVGRDPEDGLVLLSGDAVAGGVADLGPSSARSSRW